MSHSTCSPQPPLRGSLLHTAIPLPTLIPTLELETTQPIVSRQQGATVRYIAPPPWGQPGGLATKSTPNPYPSNVNLQCEPLGSPRGAGNEHSRSPLVISSLILCYSHHIKNHINMNPTAVQTPPPRTNTRRVIHPFCIPSLSSLSLSSRYQ